MKHVRISKIIALCIAFGVLFFAILAFFSDYENAKKYYNAGGENKALFLAIAKAESNFKEDAVSIKGAVGLCQLMPKTAEWCASQMGINYSKEMLFEGETNAEIAVFYINYLLGKFQEDLAICAYNAGEGNVTAWQLDADIYDGEALKKIPFKETENYLKKVKSYKKKFEFYIWLFGWDE